MNHIETAAEERQAMLLGSYLFQSSTCNSRPRILHQATIAGDISLCVLGRGVPAWDGFIDCTQAERVKLEEGLQSPLPARSWSTRTPVAQAWRWLGQACVALSQHALDMVFARF